jgi:mannose-6-phosphate isomerase-like protein (cupin superfamily)
MKALDSDSAEKTGREIAFHNRFNGETLIFPATSGGEGTFICELEPGGTGGGNALLHRHPHASETFTVTSGRLRVAVEGVDHIVNMGESITVDAGQRHFFANDAPTTTRFLTTFAPARRYRDFFMTLGWLTEKRPEWFSKRGEPDLLLVALMLDRFSGHLYLSAIPVAIQKIMFAMLAQVSLICGYRLPDQESFKHFCTKQQDS